MEDLGVLGVAGGDDGLCGGAGGILFLDDGGGGAGGILFLVGGGGAACGMLGRRGPRAEGRSFLRVDGSGISRATAGGFVVSAIRSAAGGIVGDDRSAAGLLGICGRRGRSPTPALRLGAGDGSGPRPAGFVTGPVGAAAFSDLGIKMRLSAPDEAGDCCCSMHALPGCTEIDKTSSPESCLVEVALERREVGTYAQLTSIRCPIRQCFPGSRCFKNSILAHI